MTDTPTFSSPLRLRVYAVCPGAGPDPALPQLERPETEWPVEVPCLLDRHLRLLGATPSAEPLSVPPEAEHLFVEPLEPWNLDAHGVQRLIDGLAGDERIRGLSLGEASLPAAAASRLHALPLEILDLGRCQRVAGLERALPRLTRLRWLRIGEGAERSAPGIVSALQGLERLRELSLGTGVVGDRLAAIAALPLAALGLSDALDEAGVASVARIAGLRWASFHTKGAALGILEHPVPSLEALEVSSRAEALPRVIAGAPRLRSVALFGCELTPGLVDALAGLPSIESLKLWTSGVFDALERLPDVPAIDLGTTYFAARHAGLLTTLRRTRSLALLADGREPPSLRVLERLSSPTRLERLSAKGFACGPGDAQVLARFTNLRALSLPRCRIRDAAPLASLRRLERLDLSGTLVTDATPLAGLPLRALDVEESHLTEAGYGVVARLEQLEDLALGGGLSDGPLYGVDPADLPPLPGPDALAAIRDGCPTLRSIRLSATRADEELILAVARAHPRLIAFQAPVRDVLARAARSPSFRPATRAQLSRVRALVKSQGLDVHDFGKVTDEALGEPLSLRDLAKLSTADLEGLLEVLEGEV